MKNTLNKGRYEYKYAIGEVIEVNHRKIKVVKQIRNDKNSRAYLMECQLCKFPSGQPFIYEVSEANLRKGQMCPCCSRKRLVPDINSVYITNPEYIKYFKNIEDSKNTTIGSSKKVILKCPICGEEKEDCMNNISYNGFSCPRCSDGISYPNKLAFNVLKQLDIDFECEYSPDWIKPKRYDFYFKYNNKEYIIEMDGGLGHGKRIHSRREDISLEESKIIDEYKDRMAKENNINMIRIDCDYRHHNKFEYLKNSILNSDLNRLLDLNKIDWLECYQFSCSSRIYEACDIFNSGIKSTKEISEIMKMDKSMIIGYLKQGVVLGLCDYDVDKSLEIRNNKNSEMLKRRFSKPIICLNNNQIFESSTECAKKSVEVFGFKLDRHYISDVCNKKRDEYKGLRFEYIELIS